MVNNGRSHSLPDEAKAVIWRIFGQGGSPLTKSSTYEWIEPILKDHVVHPPDQTRAITEISGWFESHGDQQWLKPDMSAPVAELIVEGIRTERSETAIWAISSVDVTVAVPTIRALWSTAEINSFVNAVIKVLKKLCDKDKVLDATRMTSITCANAKIPKETIVREGRLETFRYLDNYGFEIVHRGLQPAAGNLIELLIEVQPEQFETLIETLDHPVMQAWAASCMIARVRHSNHRETLRWIKEDSCDAIIALAIVHTLNTVNKLDEELRSADRVDTDQYVWNTELRHPHDDLDAAANALLHDLVDRLAMLDPLACARWVGEMLSDASYGLHQSAGYDKPLRIKQLESACTKLLGCLVNQSWSHDLFDELCAGLCLSPRETWTRHIVDVAWAIHNVDLLKAAEIARLTFNEHERNVAEQLKSNRLFLNWNDWHSREWIGGLGAALVLSHNELDLTKWVLERCRPLPLSVWDAEENYEAFVAADRAAQHWFLVALHAISAMEQLNRTIEPAAVRTLVVTLWEYCHFVGQYLPSHPAAFVTSELAARFAIMFGEPSDTWLLQQAGHPGVGPLALWALFDQRRLKSTNEVDKDVRYDQMIKEELIHIASNRFSEGVQVDFETLRFWAQLWLLLGAVDEAERTAMAICAFPLRAHDREYKILVLKLLALVGSKQKLTPGSTECFKLFYSQLWPGYTTPTEEHIDRQKIDEFLKLSN